MGKLRVGGDISEVGVELIIIGLVESGSREYFYVKRESEFSANSSNTSGNVCVINGSTIPSILGGLSILEKAEMSASIIAGDGLGFVEEAVVAFNTHTFVVATGKGPERNFKGGAHSFKGTTEFAISIHNNYSHHSKG